VATSATALRPNSNTPRYTRGVQAWPATEWHTSAANPGQLVTAAVTPSTSAVPRQTSTLAIAVSQAVSPSRALIPREVSGVSSTDVDQATISA
jgi:hypothetical protein